MRGKKNQKPLLPVQIKLCERELFENGTLFVKLQGYEAVEKFWRENRNLFTFACTSAGFESPVFLGDDEWVFGKSKSSVMRTVYRWGASGIGVEYYDWRLHCPKEWKSWREDVARHRQKEVENGSWSDVDEAEYQVKIAHHGWWRFKNLPNDINTEDFMCDYDPPTDPGLSINAVEEILLTLDFDSSSVDVSELNCYDSEGMELMLKNWKEFGD